MSSDTQGRMARFEPRQLNHREDESPSVWIPKPGREGEKRPTGIPTIADRALQALVKLALEPEWEARFEPNSYGFRPGRGCHDAIEAILLNVNYFGRFLSSAKARCLAVC